MKRAMFPLVAVFLVLCACVVFFYKKPIASPDISSQSPGTAGQAAAEKPMPLRAEPPAETIVSAETTEEESMSLSLSARPGLSNASTAQAPQDVTYSIKKETKERTVMPGVTYKPGEGLNMAVDEDEKIQIRRDGTYGSNQYQVLWKKTY